MLTFVIATEQPEDRTDAREIFEIAVRAIKEPDSVYVLSPLDKTLFYMRDNGTITQMPLNRNFLVLRGDVVFFLSHTYNVAGDAEIWDIFREFKPQAGSRSRLMQLQRRNGFSELVTRQEIYNSGTRTR
jgi:hypothetical protein